MRRNLAMIFAAAVAVCVISSRAHLFAASSGPEVPTVASGTEFPVEVRGSIHAAGAHPGQAVQFRTVQPILIGSGIVVPANATMMGRVIEARPATESEDSLLRFSIHLIRWSKASFIPVNAVVSGRLRARGHVRGDVHRVMPNFLEGVQIKYEPKDAATTMLTSRDNVVLRSGTLLILKHLGTAPERTSQPIPGN